MNVRYKIAALLLAGVLAAGVACADKPESATATPAVAKAAEAKPAEAKAGAVPAGARALMKAYPDFVKGYKDNKLVLADGTTMVYDDGKQKSFVERLNNPDAEDMFFADYDRANWTPGYLHDPGRVRYEPLFKKMYGASAAAVQKTLVPVKWFGTTVRITKVNGAADALRKVAEEVAKYPELKPYLKSSGTFYWRMVRGANRLSAHSFGIAFDIAVSKSDYWRYKASNEMAKFKYANKIPHKLVEIFEKHGYIWGGRWYHFDTMHFEYRPELLVK
ncbi:MAG: M15 family metallopeptidase [Bacteroidales bacterium]|nr:M15 family metallopeptidase [Bacteroidales bacterium]